MGNKFCLFTWICQTITKYWKLKRNSHPPFYYLMSRLALHFSVKPPKNAIYDEKRILDRGMMKKSLKADFVRIFGEETAACIGHPVIEDEEEYNEQKEGEADTT